MRIPLGVRFHRRPASKAWGVVVAHWQAQDGLRFLIGRTPTIAANAPCPDRQYRLRRTITDSRSVPTLCAYLQHSTPTQVQAWCTFDVSMDRLLISKDIGTSD